MTFLDLFLSESLLAGTTCWIQFCREQASGTGVIDMTYRETEETCSTNLSGRAMFLQVGPFVRRIQNAEEVRTEPAPHH